MRAFHPVDVAVFEQRQGALGTSPSATTSSRRQRIFLRASMAWCIRSAVVRLRPTARQIHAYASSKIGAVWMRSSTVSSTRVHGGSMAGCVVRRIASDRWMTTPGIFACAGWRRRRDCDGDERARLVDQTVPLGCRLVAQHRAGTGAEQCRPERSSPGSAPRRRLAYTPRCSRCQRPLRTRVRIVYGVDAHVRGPDGAPRRRPGVPADHRDRSGMSIGMRSLVLGRSSSSASGPSEPVDNSDRRRLSVDNWARHRR